MKTEPPSLLRFFFVTFALFLVVTGIAYFIWLNITMPAYLGLLLELGRGMILLVIPISLLLEAISIIIYGVLEIKLKPWQIFLSSFYVSLFAVWIFMPHTLASRYSSFAGALNEPLAALILSLFIAGIPTIAYVKLKAR
jgi:hypothetical protein